MPATVLLRSNSTARLKEFSELYEQLLFFDLANRRQLELAGGQRFISSLPESQLREADPGLRDLTLLRLSDPANEGMRKEGARPLNLDGYLFEWRGAKATQVKQRLAADFTGWETDNAKFEHEFERVVRALRTDGGREPAPEGRL